MKTPTIPSRQRGVSLVVTLVLVVLLSLLALYGAGVLILDTRSAANDYRAKEALAAAEAGLDQGYSLLSINRRLIKAVGLDLNNDGDAADANESGWTACTSGTTTAPCVAIRSDDRGNWSYLTINAALAIAPTQGSFTLFLMTPSSGDSNRLTFFIVAQGLSADSSSRAIAKQGAYFYPLILGEVDTPLAAANNIPLSGNYSIITNSNGGGSGVPVTAWSDSAITPGGSFASCHLGEFSGGACPSGDALSKNGLTGPDLVGSDPDFPPDLFQFLFGVAESDYVQIKNQATVSADCSGLSSASEGIQWVTGDCNPPGQVGSADRPVLLVVEGDTTLNAGDQFYGLLYMFDPAGTVPRLISNGNAHLHGAIIAHDGVDLQLTGGFVLEYDAAVLGALSRNTSSRGLTRLPGSWSDVQL
jgi:type II secretory pathway pseudopilin PulG